MKIKQNPYESRVLLFKNRHTESNKKMYYKNSNQLFLFRQQIFHAQHWTDVDSSNQISSDQNDYPPMRGSLLNWQLSLENIQLQRSDTRVRSLETKVESDRTRMRNNRFAAVAIYLSIKRDQGVESWCARFG